MKYIAAGQAFMMKLRKTVERSPTSMIIEPPKDINGSYVDLSDPPRWRYLKYVAIHRASRSSSIDTFVDKQWGKMLASLEIEWTLCGPIVKPTKRRARSNPHRMSIVPKQRPDFGTLLLMIFPRLFNMRHW
jgi:hypothetical protein